MRMTLTRKVLILLAFPTLLQLGTLGIFLWMQSVYTNAMHWYIHSKEVVKEVDRLFITILQAQTSIRGFALSRNELFLALFVEASERIDPLTESLVNLVSDNPEQSDRASNIRNATQDLLGWMNLLKARVLREPKPDREVESQHILEGKKQMDSLHEQMQSFLSREDDFENQRFHSVTQIKQWMYGLIIGGTILSLLLTGLLGYMFWQDTGRRFYTLTVNTERLATNKPLLPQVGGQDEIAQLDRSFHNMANQLQNAREAIHQLNLELEERVQHRTKELANANRELLQKNQENEMFVYSVSHDLRSPLVNLQGFSKELGKGCDALATFSNDNRIPQEVRDSIQGLLTGKMTKSLGFIQTSWDSTIPCGFFAKAVYPQDFNPKSTRGSG